MNIAGNFATAQRGYDGQTIRYAEAMLAQNGSYQATSRATGVPESVLRAVCARPERTPVVVRPVARVIGAPEKPASIGRLVTVAEIQKAVAKFYGLSMADLLGASQTRAIARPRQVAMYLCKRHTSRSYPDLGQRFWGRDHTTILHGVRKIEELIEADDALKHDIQAITEYLAAGTDKLDRAIVRVERRLALLKAAAAARAAA